MVSRSELMESSVPMKGQIECDQEEEQSRVSQQVELVLRLLVPEEVLDAEGVFAPEAREAHCGSIAPSRNPLSVVYHGRHFLPHSHLPV